MIKKTKAAECVHIQEKISKLLNDLGIEYNDIKIYIQSFIHKSIVNERNDYAPKDNERLEFLGDAILELIITKKLYFDYQEKNEGELTDYRSTIVRGTNLANTASELKFEEYLLLGKGEEKIGGRQNNYILANTMEAFLGALYIDKGYEIVENFILKYIYSKLENILENSQTKDYKTLFQEIAQAEFEITPNYILISESGPDHNKNFEVGVYVGEKILGIGTGTSKKKAQEKAAELAFNSLKIKNDNN